MKKLYALSVVFLVFLAGCETVPPEPADYSAYRTADPRSILILPALNQTVAVEAPEFFLSTVSRPFAERGYYTFPAHMVKRVLEEEGLSDTQLIYDADPRSMGRLFGCDAALYINIERWESQYLVFSTTTTVAFHYQLKSCHTGDLLWENQQMMQYTPDSGQSSGNALVDLVAMAVVAAVEKAAPNYIPLAQQANAFAATIPNKGIPAGPYLAEAYGTDYAAFPVPGGVPTNEEAVDTVPMEDSDGDETVAQ